MKTITDPTFSATIVRENNPDQPSTFNGWTLRDLMIELAAIKPTCPHRGRIVSITITLENK